MYLGLNIGSLLFEGEPLDTNSGDPVNIALPKLQRETDSASTPASKLLSDYTIAEVKNNSNRIDESVLKADFCNTLDKICQEVHHQNCEELSKQSLENALEFQGGVDEDFIKEKVSDIDIGSLSPLFEGELLDTNIGDPVNIALPNLQRETDSASTPASNLLSDYTIAEVENNSNRIDESVLKADFCNTFDKICQEAHHQYFEDLENALEFQGRVDEDFIKEKVSDIDVGSLSLLFGGELLEVNSDDQIYVVLPQLQQQTDSASTPASNLLSDYTIAEVENNSKYQDHCNRIFSSSTPSNSKGSRKKANSQILNRIDESALREDFCKTLDKVCREKHHQNFEELSKQSLKNALEFQGRVYQDFIKKKVELSKKQLVSTDRYGYPCIVTNCSFTQKYKAHLGRHFFKHIKVSPHYCEQCLPNIFFARDKIDLNKHERRIHRLDKVIPKLSIKRIHKPDQNTIVENNSDRIDESVLKEDFYNTLDKKCQEKHHQNFEELSKQSLENALEFQGGVDEDFIKEKVSDIDIGSLSPLFEGELLDTNIGDPVNIALPKLQRETDSASTPASKLLSDYTIAEVENNSNRIDESVLKADFCNTLDKICQEVHHQYFEDPENGLEFQGRVDEDFIKEKVSDIDIGSLPSLFGGELPEVNSDDQIYVVLPQLQQQTDSASTPASNLLSDYTIAQVENNSKYQDHCNRIFSSSTPSNSKGSRKKANSQILNRIDESALREDFCKTLDKVCREKHHQNFEELSKQSLKNALEFQGRVYQDFIKKKVELSKKQLVSTDRYGYPCIVTNCSFTQKYKAHLGKHFFKHIKVSPHYCEQCLPNIFFARDKTDLNKHERRVHRLDKVIPKRSIKRIHKPAQNTIVENNSNSIDESILKADFCNTLDKICQGVHHQNFEEFFKQSLENALDFQGGVDEDFIKEKVSDIDIGSLSPLFEGELLDTNIGDPVNIALPKLQRETDSASTPASKLLSDYTIAEVENNSNRIDESVLKADFCNTLDKICQEVHHQYFEDPENGLEFQGRVDEDFIKEKVSDIDIGSLPSLFGGELPEVNSDDQIYVVLPQLQQQTDSASTPASNLLSDYTIAQVENNSKYQDHCNRIFSSSTPSNSKGSRKKANSQILNRIDESALREDFCKTLDKVCREKHHQNFEELSKQSLKNALEFQGRVYQDFIKKKVELSKKQLVSTDRYGYPCIVTNCSFTQKYKAHLGRHFFKHIKVSPHYCEQCLPNIFFARDMGALNAHKKKRFHSLYTAIPKPDQSTMNGSSGLTVSQVSDPCLLLSGAKQAKTDP